MILNRVHLPALVIGCASGAVLTLIGAAYAIDNSTPALDTLKGDRVAIEVTDKPSLTIEEVNPDIGVSNLIRIERDRPVL
jgi:hypothetical protein